MLRLLYAFQIELTWVSFINVCIICLDTMRHVSLERDFDGKNGNLPVRPFDITPNTAPSVCGLTFTETVALCL